MLFSFSNHGASVVDLTAPGVLVAAPYPGSTWVFMSGTSMSAPNAAGVAALLAAVEPQLSPAQLIERLVTTGSSTPAWEGLAIDAVRPSAAGAVPFADPDAVVFSRLGAYVADDGVEVVDIATELVAAGSAGRTVGVTLAVWYEGAAYAVLDHPVEVDVGAAVLELTTDDEGRVSFTLPSDGQVGLATALPLGDYAWIVEPSGREPATGTFSVLDEAAASAPAPTPPAGGAPPGDGGGGGPSPDDGAVPVVPPGGDEPAPAPGDGSGPPPASGGSQPPPPADDTDGGAPAPADGSSPPASGGGGSPAPSQGGSEPAPDGAGDDAPPSGGGTPSEPVASGDGSSPPPATAEDEGATSEPAPAEPGPQPAADGAAPEPGSGSSPGPSPEPSPPPTEPAPDAGGGSGGGSTGVLPSSGDPGISVEVRGSWPSGVRVRFGSNPAYVRTVGPLSASVVVPSSSVTGPVDVTVLSAGGDVLAVLPGAFTYAHEVTTAPGGSTPPSDDGGGGSSPDAGAGSGPAAGGGGSGPSSGGGGTDPDGATDQPWSGGGGGESGGSDSGWVEPGDPGSADPGGPGTPAPGGSGGGPAPGGGDAGGSEPDAPAPGGPGPGDPGTGDPGSGDTSRTSGAVMQTSTGLSVVRLGGGHPGAGLSASAWPSTCTNVCRVTGAS